MPVPGLTNVGLTGTLSGASVTGNLAGTVDFSGTFSADGLSGEGTWTGPGFGTYIMAKQSSTPGGPVSIKKRTVFFPDAILPDASLTFPITSTLGDTAIIGTTTTSFVPPEFLFEGQIFHVITTVSPTGPGTGPYRFCAFYPGTTGSMDRVGKGKVFETTLKIGHLEPGPPPHWDLDRHPASSTFQNFVCGEFDSLSEFAIVSSGPVGGLVTILSADHSAGARVWPYVAVAALAVFSLGVISLWRQRRRRLN